MTLLKCNHLIFTNLFFCYFHSFCYDSKHLRKKLHLFTLFFNHPSPGHCFSLFLVGSKSMLALLPFKVTITPRHWNDKCFHRADAGDLICRFCICASHFQCIVGAQQEILCLTVRTTWLIWRVWPRSLGMSVPVWQRHREVELIEKCATKTQHFVASTPFVHNSVSHDHIVVPFMTFLAVLTDRACRHESDFSQPLEDGSDSTCGRRVHAVQNKTPEQTSACFACKYGPT